MIPVGYGEVTPLQRHRDHVWLGHVIIRPEDRGRGIGARFVQELLSEACEALAATRAILVVFPDNISAIRCYRRVGFTVVGEERHRFRAGFPPERLLRLEIDLPV